MILCVTLNPVVDTTFFIDRFAETYRTEASSVVHLAGGKGNNVARTLKCLGWPARVFNPLGGTHGRILEELLVTEGVEQIPARISGETRQVVTLVDALHQQRAYFAPPVVWTEVDVTSVREGLVRSLPGCRAACFCGSSPSRLADGLYAGWIAAARRVGVITLLDTYGEALRLGILSQPDILKINLKEAEELLGRALATPEHQRNALLELQARGIGWVVITLGEKGSWFGCDGQMWLARSPQVNVINPIGSGDALAAGLILGRVQGRSPIECFRFGMAAAVANVLSWEAGRVDPADIERLQHRIEVLPL